MANLVISNDDAVVASLTSRERSMALGAFKISSAYEFHSASARTSIVDWNGSINDSRVISCQWATCNRHIFERQRKKSNDKMAKFIFFSKCLSTYVQVHLNTNCRPKRDSSFHCQKACQSRNSTLLKPILRRCQLLRHLRAKAQVPSRCRALVNHRRSLVCVLYSFHIRYNLNFLSTNESRVCNLHRLVSCYNMDNTHRFEQYRHCLQDISRTLQTASKDFYNSHKGY